MDTQPEQLIVNVNVNGDRKTYVLCGRTENESCNSNKNIGIVAGDELICPANLQRHQGIHFRAINEIIDLDEFFLHPRRGFSGEAESR